METGQLRDRYVGLLIDRVEETRYPSSPMLDRAERALRTRDEAESYIGALLDIVEQDRYPSPSMLDRISRLLDLI